MKTILWLVGEPGVGKTSVVRELLPQPRVLVVKPKWTLSGGLDTAECVAAGHYTGQVFDGADTVPYNGAASALAFWRERLATQAKWTLLDGDRFSSANSVAFFQALAMPLQLCCVLLQVSAEVLLQRRGLRGSNQNEAWMKGRGTKALRFWQAFPEADRMLLSAEQPAVEVATALREWLGSRG